MVLVETTQFLSIIHIIESLYSGVTETTQFNSINNILSYPVSYTHLDVYKRQRITKERLKT